MLETHENNPLTQLLQTLIRNDASAAARALETLPEAEAGAVFRTLPQDSAALVLPHFQLNYAADLVKDMDPTSFKTVVRGIKPKRAASLLMRLPPDALERLLPHAPKKLKDEARELLIYPEGSVGRIMHTDYLSFHEEERARDAIRKIRKLGSQRYPASYAYVVDGDERLRHAS
jgi:magnesium transporter